MTKHYKARGGIEPVEYFMSNNMNYLESNIIKYIHRYPFKGRPLEDLHKAKECIEMLIKWEQATNDALKKFAEQERQAKQAQAQLNVKSEIVNVNPEGSLIKKLWT